MKKVSIIIPAYNVEKYIPRTLESIKSQTFKDIEVIVINDGSTDNTLTIVKNFLKNVDFSYKIITQKNQGVSAARNRGIKEAKGKYICFLDGDDFYDSFFIGKMERKLNMKLMLNENIF